MNSIGYSDLMSSHKYVSWNERYIELLATNYIFWMMNDPFHSVTDVIEL